MGGAVPATPGVDFCGVLHFFDGHKGFVSEMISVSLFAMLSTGFRFDGLPRDPGFLFVRKRLYSQ